MDICRFVGSGNTNNCKQIPNMDIVGFLGSGDDTNNYKPIHVDADTIYRYVGFLEVEQN